MKMAKAIIIEYPPETSWQIIESTLSKLGVKLKLVKYVPNGYRAEIIVVPIPPEPGRNRQ
jgi:hypothetical protein